MKLAGMMRSFLPRDPDSTIKRGGDAVIEREIEKIHANEMSCK